MNTKYGGSIGACNLKRCDRWLCVALGTVLHSSNDMGWVGLQYGIGLHTLFKGKVQPSSAEACIHFHSLVFQKKTSVQHVLFMFLNSKILARRKICCYSLKISFLRTENT